MTNFTSVKKFMETFGQEVKTKAEFPSDKIMRLRYDLIKEELDEFEEVFSEYGDHLQSKGLRSTVYVFRNKTDKPFNAL